ncbi:hypothetical protein OH77DRAFT_1429906 [Trametes cingulata]|nr:hypothetical protein OH77DRAFT_1429906 [Trametes cingulata]
MDRLSEPQQKYSIQEKQGAERASSRNREGPDSQPPLQHFGHVELRDRPEDVRLAIDAATRAEASLAVLLRGYVVQETVKRDTGSTRYSGPGRGPKSATGAIERDARPESETRGEMRDGRPAWVQDRKPQCERGDQRPRQEMRELDGGGSPKSQ